MNIIVSGVTTSKEGKKQAYIKFDSGERYCEAVIPDCKVTINHGFNEMELSQIEDYLHENLLMLKQEAMKNNPFSAMMK